MSNFVVYQESSRDCTHLIRNEVWGRETCARSKFVVSFIDDWGSITLCTQARQAAFSYTTHVFASHNRLLDLQWCVMKTCGKWIKTMSLCRYWGLYPNTTTLDDIKKYFKPYKYGHATEMIAYANGTYRWAFFSCLASLTLLHHGYDSAPVAPLGSQNLSLGEIL